MKKFKIILGMGLVIAVSSFGFAIDRPSLDDASMAVICGDVTFSCGSTGRICGWEGDGFLARYREANSQVCEQQN